MAAMRFIALILFLIPCAALAHKVTTDEAAWEVDHARRVAAPGNGNPCKNGIDDGHCYIPKPFHPHRERMKDNH